MAKTKKDKKALGLLSKAKPETAKQPKKAKKQKSERIDNSNVLKIIPLGGVDGIGMNMTAFEYGDDIIVVDCGVAFPEGDMLGIDLVIPDFTYLKNNSEKLRALFLTHGHEDHIGAVPYFLDELNVPVYGTRLTLGIVEGKLQEHGIKNAELIDIEPGETVGEGCFDVEFIGVNHSIPDAVAFCISTPVGRILHTGDFKVDFAPVGQKPIDLPRIAALGSKGIRLLMCDSTNVENPGYTPSESTIADAFDRIFTGCERRIIVATFSTNVHRIQQILNAAEKQGRKVALFGRSMLNVMKAATKLGYIKIPDGLLIDSADLKHYPPEKTVLVTTGSQGEPMSALYRMAFGEHSAIAITSGDLVILSSSSIPGNEKLITNVVNELSKRGAEVITAYNDSVHVSGHACREELKLIHFLSQAENFVPVHGEYKHLVAHARLAKSMGMNPKNILIPEIGRVIELGKKGAVHNGTTVEAGQLLVDGNGVGDVGTSVLRDRRQLSESGLIVINATVDFENEMLISKPEIITKGFVYVKENSKLIEEIEGEVTRIIEKYLRKGVNDPVTLKTKIRDELGSLLGQRMKRNPVIMTVFAQDVYGY